MVQRVHGRSLVLKWAPPFDDWKTLPATRLNGLPFTSQGRIRQLKGRDGLGLSYVVPKIKLDSSPYLSYSY